MHEPGEGTLYGVLAEFRTADELLHAARAAAQVGYRDVEAYAPFPVEGLADAVGFERNIVPAAALVGGVCGGLGAYFMQWYSAVVAYPFNIGGRPPHSWPSFIPATFELTILGAALAAVAVMLAANGLPQLHHPIFAAPQFDLATRNRFFLCVRATGKDFDRANVRAWLVALDPLEVCEVRA
jgi:hypothetical protein